MSEAVSASSGTTSIMIPQSSASFSWINRDDLITWDDAVSPAVPIRPTTWATFLNTTDRIHVTNVQDVHPGHPLWKHLDYGEVDPNRWLDAETFNILGSAGTEYMLSSSDVADKLGDERPTLTVNQFQSIRGWNMNLITLGEMGRRLGTIVDPAVLTLAASAGMVTDMLSVPPHAGVSPMYYDQMYNATERKFTYNDNPRKFPHSGHVGPYPDEFSQTDVGGQTLQSTTSMIYRWWTQNEITTDRALDHLQVYGGPNPSLLTTMGMMSVSALNSLGVLNADFIARTVGTTKSQRAKVEGTVVLPAGVSDPAGVLGTMGRGNSQSLAYIMELFNLSLGGKPRFDGGYIPSFDVDVSDAGVAWSATAGPTSSGDYSSQGVDSADTGRMLVYPSKGLAGIDGEEAAGHPVPSLSGTREQDTGAFHALRELPLAPLAVKSLAVEEYYINPPTSGSATPTAEKVGETFSSYAPVMTSPANHLPLTTTAGGSAAANDMVVTIRFHKAGEDVSQYNTVPNCFPMPNTDHYSGVSPYASSPVKGWYYTGIPDSMVPTNLQSATGWGSQVLLGWDTSLDLVGFPKMDTRTTNTASGIVNTLRSSDHPIGHYMTYSTSPAVSKVNHQEGVVALLAHLHFAGATQYSIDLWDGVTGAHVSSLDAKLNFALDVHSHDAEIADFYNRDGNAPSESLKDTVTGETNGNVFQTAAGLYKINLPDIDVVEDVGGTQVTIDAKSWYWPYANYWWEHRETTEDHSAGPGEAYTGRAFGSLGNLVAGVMLVPPFYNAFPGGSSGGEYIGKAIDFKMFEGTDVGSPLAKKAMSSNVQVRSLKAKAPNFICADRPEARAKFRPERTLFDMSVINSLRLLVHTTVEGTGSQTLAPSLMRAAKDLRIPVFGQPQRRKTFIFFQDLPEIMQNDVVLEGISLLHPLTNAGDRSRATVTVYPAQENRVPELLPAARELNQMAMALGASYASGMFSVENVRQLQSSMQLSRLGR